MSPNACVEMCHNSLYALPIMFLVPRSVPGKWPCLHMGDVHLLMTTLWWACINYKSCWVGVTGVKCQEALLSLIIPLQEPIQSGLHAPLIPTDASMAPWHGWLAWLVWLVGMVGWHGWYGWLAWLVDMVGMVG